MNRVLRSLSLALAGLLVAGTVAGCGSSDVAVKVNGEVIKKSAIDAQLDQLKKQYPNMFQGTDGKTRSADFYARLLDQEINKVLVQQEAKREGISITDAQVQKEIDTLKKGFPTEQAFTDALKQNGMTLEQLKEQEKIQLASQALLDKLVKNVKVTDAEIQDYYTKNKDTVFTAKAAIHAAHILFDEKDKAAAEKALAEIKANPARFAEIAKKESKDTASAAKGGDLGWPSSPYVPEFEKAIESLQKGQMAQSLVHTQFGWHIIKVIEKRGDQVKPLAEVKDQIVQILEQQKKADAFQKLLDDLKKKAKIEYPAGKPESGASSTATSTK